MTDVEPPLAQVIRLALGEAARESTPEANPRDRMLVAATLLVVAVVVAWPKDRPAPAPVAAAYRFGQDVWTRRGWWMN